VSGPREQLQSSLGQRYALEGELGEGGMAIVFRATDLKHERDVAVKVLRPELSAVIGADRFLREIRVTARLQHPHILPLYDSGVAGDLLYYVMPLVRGESLRDRLTRERQLPVSEAIHITTVIAGALDYAHRQGVLHRDIKPENILLHDGQPVLGDFGIALAVATAGGDRLTHSGLVVGTPSYMSPEQVSGDALIDGRSDIYALACVAYEMLAGEPPFAGPTARAVIAAVMTKDARPLRERRHTVPEGVAVAIHRGLEPVPADRYATAADFGSALALDAGTTHRAPRRAPGWWLAGSVAVAAGIAVGVLATTIGGRATAASVRRWSIDLRAAPVALAGTTPALGATAIALSPAGDRLAYVTARGNTTLLALRALDADSSTVLPGTEGAYYPFFSSDGAWIGFFSGNLLRKVPANGGTPITLSAVDHITGAAWPNPDRILMFENQGFALRWISASGGSVDSTVRLTTQFGAPDVLPGGEWAVGQLTSGQLALVSLAHGTELAITRRGVLPLDSVREADLLFAVSPQWLPSGHLVYGAGDGVLTALPFDGRRLRVKGGPVSLFSGVRMEAGFGYGEFAVSNDGTLVYVPGNNQFYVNLAFVTPDGRIDSLAFPRGAYNQPRISPDGARVATQFRDPGGGWELLVMDLASGVRQRINVAGDYRPFPASWLPSGRELMIGLWDPVQYLNHGARIQSLETGQWTDLHLANASYMTVSPDGQRFVFSDWRTGDLYLRSLGADTTRVKLGPRGIAATFSPDGRWLAWGDVNGSVAVSPLPATGAIYTVAEHGEKPVWTPSGDALIYRDGSEYLRVPITTSTSGIRAGKPRLLVRGAFLSTFAWNHAMSRDGRLLVLLNSPEVDSPSLRAITGFPTMVQRMAGSK
jgi:serine/threonine protein kinase/Tol biopolymer transport system component